MNDDLQAFALKSTLAQIKDTCPYVSNTFIFTDQGDLLAKDDDTDEEKIANASKALKALSKKAEAIGGFESAFFYNPTNQMNVFQIDDYYLTVISSESPDRKDAANIARVLIPTVLKLTEKIREFSQEKTIKIKKPEAAEEKPVHVKKIRTTSTAEATVTVEPPPAKEQMEPEAEFPSFLPDPPVAQFMVENVGGLLAAPDTVRIDNSIMQQWKEMYGEKAITEVDVETLNGQTIRCKFKPIKDSKHDGKGTVQLPQKIQHLLQTSKGELVMVKPAL